MEDKKRLFYVLPILIPVIIILAYLMYIISYVQPKIAFGAQIANISSADYERILDNKQVISQDKGIEKFRHIRVEIKVTTPFGLGLIKSVKIERDLLHKYLESDDRIQILSGGGSEHGNGKEYTDNIEIYLRDISEDDLRILFKDFKVKVTWESKWNSQKDKIFYLRDYLK
jgi:hypothetical protein